MVDSTPSRGPEEPDASPTIPLEGTEWRLADHLGPDGELVPVADGVVASATFADGRVTGSTGCNRYNGAYKIEGANLSVEPLAMTRMACLPAADAVERAMTAALNDAAMFTITGDALELADADGRVHLRFGASPSRSLVGTRWVATGINNGRGGVVSALEGADVTAVFDEEGRVAGSGGCNEFSGPYEVDADKLHIGTLAATQKACFAPEGVGEQEASYFAALARVTSWSIREDRLQLRADDGALQVDYRTIPIEPHEGATSG